MKTVLIAVLAISMLGLYRFAESTETSSSAGCTEVSLNQPVGSPFLVGDEPQSIVIEDLNLDGRPDLITANFNSDNVTVLLGNGNGGFSKASGSPFAVGDGPRFVAVGDFNLDGKVDLTTANFNSDNVTILLGNGTGGFSEATASPFAVPDGPNFVVVSDFNLDGRLDLVSANFNSDNVRVMMGDGDGGFTEVLGSPYAVGDGPRSATAGDFNLDGNPDLATANFNSDQVTILLGDGNGGFSQATGPAFGVGDGPGSVAVVDLNLDGQPDLVTANGGSNNVTVLLSDGNGGFSQAPNSPFAAGKFPRSVAVADINLDGKPDLTTGNSNSDNVTVLFGDGSGGFSQASGSPMGVGDIPRSVAVGDFNRDNKPDIATANAFSDNVSVLLNICDAYPCSDPYLSPIPGDFGSISAIGDFNNDGKPDLVSGSTVLLGNGNGGFIPAPGSSFSGTGEESIDSLADMPEASFTTNGSLGTEGNSPVGDFNNDGKLDLVLTGSLLLGNGSGGFSQSLPHGLNEAQRNIVITDFNLDGKLDLAGRVRVLLGNGNGGFVEAPGSPISTGFANAVVTGDFNRDGNPDLIISAQELEPWTIAFGDGNGNFSTSDEVDGCPDTFSLAVGDLNRDGATDLVAATLAYLCVPGASEESSDIPDRPLAVAVADFNLDGNPDVITTNVDFFTMLLGDGTGNLSTRRLFSEGKGAPSLIVGDLNLDGRPDVAAGGTVLLNGCSGRFKLTISDTVVKEKSSGFINADFVVMLDPVPDVDVQVRYTTSNGTATTNDYVSSVGTLIIPAGQSTGTITVPVKGDGIAESDETFFVNLSLPFNATIVDNQAQATILNIKPRITINDISVIEGNIGDTKAIFTLSSSFPYSNARVNYVTESSTAKSGLDFVQASGTINVQSTTSKTLTLRVIGDKLLESNETFRVRLSSSDASIDDSVGICTITNDDGAPSLRVNDVTVTEGNSGTVNARFTITQSAVSGLNTRVTFKTANGTARSGATQDYLAKNVTVFIPPGSTAITVDVPVNGDTLVETNETFFVNLTGPLNATIADAQGIGTITNDD